MFRRLDPALGSNDLTARWAGTLGDRSSVLSGAGVWPLLAVLAAGAAGPAREQLEDATGVPANKALGAAGELMRLLASSEAVRAALGVWTAAAVALRPDWADRVPPGTRGTLTGDVRADQAAVDEWAAEHTGGRIPAMPVRVASDTPMLLASALLVRTEWYARFAEAPVPWGGREVDGLRRTTSGLDAVTVYDSPAGALTTVAVAGEHDVVVHLVLGTPEQRAARLLPAAVEAVTGRGAEGRPGAAAGPGLRETRESRTDGPGVRLLLPRFDVAASHDLTELAGVFGLTAALDASVGHFPGISDHPLAVAQAKQDAVASFTATGFEAAAVTAFAMRVGSAPARPSDETVIEATFDRPFGFVAVHRPSRLVLVAGWVADAG